MVIGKESSGLNGSRQGETQVTRPSPIVTLAPGGVVEISMGGDLELNIVAQAEARLIKQRSRLILRSRSISSIGLVQPNHNAAM